MESDDVIIIDSPRHVQIALELAEKWGVTVEEVLIRVLKAELLREGIEQP